MATTVSTPKASARPETWIALLGRRDLPVDGIENYCTFLGRALFRHGIELKRVRVEWIEDGWWRALRQLESDAAGWRGCWVLVQYTALSWSRRGFPFAALIALAILRRRGVRCAVVFHEPWSHGNASRWLDRMRGICQEWVVGRLYGGAARVIFADPLQNIGWLPKDDAKSAFIPIGANIPEWAAQTANHPGRNGAARIVVVFCLGNIPYVEEELCDIANAVRVAVKNGANLRIIFMGRGTGEARQEIERTFRDVPVEVSNLGLLDAVKVSDVLAQADAMLCVRGRLYLRRGSAIAGIACGLPLIGYAGGAEGTPLASAGVLLVPYRDTEALGAELARVLSDSNLAGQLREKSREAHQKYFCWEQIATKFVRTLGT